MLCLGVYNHTVGKWTLLPLAIPKLELHQQVDHLGVNSLGVTNSRANSPIDVSRTGARHITKSTYRRVLRRRRTEERQIL